MMGGDNVVSRVKTNGLVSGDPGDGVGAFFTTVRVPQSAAMGDVVHAVGAMAGAVEAAPVIAAKEAALGEPQIKFPDIPDFRDPMAVEAVTAASQAKLEDAMKNVDPHAENFSPDELFFRTVLLAHGHLKAHSKEQKQFQKRFSAELKLNEDIKKDYGKCATYEAQRNFKVKWAEMKEKEAQQTRIQKEISINLDEVDGEYCTFSRILAREGGDQPAYRTTCTWVANAVGLYKESKTFGGHPYLKYDIMRACAVVLHVRDTIKMSNGVTREIQTAGKPEARAEAARDGAVIGGAKVQPSEVAANSGMAPGKGAAPKGATAVTTKGKQPKRTAPKGEGNGTSTEDANKKPKKLDGDKEDKTPGKEMFSQIHYKPLGC